MKNFLLALGLLWFGTALAHAEDMVDFGPPQPLQIVQGDTVISLSVEFADDPITRRQGLMFREQMADTAGMLFDFETKVTVNMWMKNTLIPLDMIFLDEHGRVVSIARNAKPHSLRRISSNVPVMAVLEINAGLARKWELKRGDMVRHLMFDNEKPDKPVPKPEVLTSQ